MLSINLALGKGEGFCMYQYFLVNEILKSKCPHREKITAKEQVLPKCSFEMVGLSTRLTYKISPTADSSPCEIIFSTTDDIFPSSTNSALLMCPSGLTITTALQALMAV